MLNSGMDTVANFNRSRFANLKALLVDDMPAMRANLRAQLQQLGISDVEQASTAKDALRLITARATGRPFDLILCDYNLGEATNGQQLLAHVRAKHLLPPVTIWFMVTAEASYDLVACAVDCAPDDYLIKPFSATNLESRLLRHFERQEALEPALKKMAADDLEGAAAQFTELIASGSKFTMDALRMKARCLTRLHRHEDAKAVFEQALSIRQHVPWAELGYATALRDIGDVDGAHAAAAAIAAANPDLVGAHKLLAEIHEARGEEMLALDALRKAETIVPSADRSRAVGELANRVGELEVAKTAYAKVVASTRYSVTRDHYDSTALAQIYVDTGEAAKALEVLKPVQKSQDGDRAFQAIAASVEARAHRENNDEAAAGAALERALGLVKDAAPEAALAVSRACFALGRHAEGEKIVTHAVRANHEDASLLKAARKVLKDSGREEISNDLIDAQVGEVLELTAKAIALAKQARLAEAQTMITEAVAGLPRNVGVLVAAAQIDLSYLSLEGMDHTVVARVRGYLKTLQTLAPRTERVDKMSAYFRQLLKKPDMAPAR